MPAAVDGAWHIGAPHAKCGVCGVHVLDGTETHEDVFKGNGTHQRHGTLVVRTSIVERYDGSGSGTLVLGQRPGGSIRWTGLDRVQDPDSNVRFSRENQPCLTTVPHRLFGISASHGLEEPT